MGMVAVFVLGFARGSSGSRKHSTNRKLHETSLSESSAPAITRHRFKTRLPSPKAPTTMQIPAPEAATCLIRALEPWGGRKQVLFVNATMFVVEFSVVIVA